MTEPKKKPTVPDWVKVWAPIMLAVAGWIWTGSAVYSQVLLNTKTLAEQRESEKKQGIVISNMNTLIMQQQVMIKHNEKEIDRLRDNNGHPTP